MNISDLKQIIMQEVLETQGKCVRVVLTEKYSKAKRNKEIADKIFNEVLKRMNYL